MILMHFTSIHLAKWPKKKLHTTFNTIVWQSFYANGCDQFSFESVCFLFTCFQAANGNRMDSTVWVKCFIKWIQRSHYFHCSHFWLWKDVYPSTTPHSCEASPCSSPTRARKKYASLWNNQSWPCVYFTLQERHDDTHITWHGNGVSLMPWLPWGRLFTYQDSRKYWIGLVTNSILFCCFFSNQVSV